MSKVIQMECASWFIRDDGLVQILNRLGKKVILNHCYSCIWEGIGYGIKLVELEEDMKKVIGDIDLQDILQDLSKKRLIKIKDEDENDFFDSIFI